MRVRLGILLPLATAAPAAGLAQAPALVLRGATVIDGTDRPPMSDVTVIVKNGWITAVGPRAETAVPRGARVVELRGQYLLPGFVEMHGHLAIAAWQIDSSGGTKRLTFPYDDLAARQLTASQLAFGITTVRNPAGPTRESVALRNRVRSGELVGPRIITAGAPLDRPSINTAMDAVTTEAEVRAAVAHQAALGVDFIKLYSTLDSAQVRAAIDEAHRHGIPAVGHLWLTAWTDAAEAGIDGITHIIVNNAKLLPERHRAEYLKGIHGGQFMFDWFRYADFDGPEITSMIAALVAHRITIDPTLVAFESTAWSEDSTHYPAESRRYVPPSLAVSVKKTPKLGWTREEFAGAQQQFRRMQELTRRLFLAGIVLTVGTDAANPWFYHRELELLAESGIPSADVIRMATRNAAISLRRTAEFGTVEVGRRADFVVLDADPVADIRNTRRIAWVVQDGRIARPASFLPPAMR
jgi:imidazolonepropionase-like amidohydrolase